MLEMFSNTALIITTSQSPPYLWNRTRLDDGTIATGNDRYYGYCADLMAELAKREDDLKNYILKPVADEQYGARLENGSWTGMIGELVEGVRI